MDTITFPILLASTVLAAILTGTINILLAWRKSREEERSRVRTVFAEAFAAYAEYKEYPYVIRRRNIEKPGEERVRISEQIRQTQEHLNYYLAWTRAESDDVGLAYDALIEQVRASAGVAMKEAWQQPAITEDAAMIIPSSQVDLGSLKTYELAYTTAIRKHLNKISSWWPKKSAETVQETRVSDNSGSAGRRVMPLLEKMNCHTNRGR